MLFRGLKSEAKISFSTRGSFNEPHQLPQHRQELRTPLSSALVSRLQSLCRDRKGLGGALSHRGSVSPAGWQITSRPQRWRSRRPPQNDVAVGAQRVPGASGVFPARHQGRRSTNLPGRWRPSCVSREQLARLALAWLGLRFGWRLVCSKPIQCLGRFGLGFQRASAAWAVPLLLSWAQHVGPLVAQGLGAPACCWDHELQHGDASPCFQGSRACCCSNLPRAAPVAPEPAQLQAAAATVI